MSKSIDCSSPRINGLPCFYYGLDASEADILLQSCSALSSANNSVTDRGCEMELEAAAGYKPVLPPGSRAKKDNSDGGDGDISDSDSGGDGDTGGGDGGGGGVVAKSGDHRQYASRSFFTPPVNNSYNNKNKSKNKNNSGDNNTGNYNKKSADYANIKTSPTNRQAAGEGRRSRSTPSSMAAPQVKRTRRDCLRIANFFTL